MTVDIESVNYPSSQMTNQYWFEQGAKLQVEELSSQQQHQGPTSSALPQVRYEEIDHT